MISRISILGALFIAAASIGAASVTSAAVRSESAAPPTASAQTGVATATSSMGAGVMPAAALVAGARSTTSNAVAFGQAAADSEEPIPASNMAVMLLAAIGAMGLVVIRRSSSR